MPKKKTEKTKLPSQWERVRTYQQFEKLLSGGHEEYYYEYTLLNGEVIGEDAPFDATDPMSYMMGRLIYLNPQLCCKFYAKIG